jgi:hypothetical protein
MKDLRKLARGEPCMNCGSTDESVVLAHYSGLRQHTYGKGRGIKGSDWLAAPQCMRCHSDGPFAEGWLPLGLSGVEAKVDKSEQQLHQIAMWHKSLAERGLL